MAIKINGIIQIPNTLGSAGQVLTVNSGATAGEWATSASTLDGLSDVSTSGVTSGQVLKYNGTNWTPASGGGITTGKAIAMAMVFG